MKRISLIMGIIFLLLYVNTAYGQSVNPQKGLPVCQSNLETTTDDLATCDTDLQTCYTDLQTCDTDLAACEAAGGQIFPGDGYSDPSFGTNGHEPVLGYTDNSDGTFTDDNTGFMWEKKDDAGGVHDKVNTYTWTAGTKASDTASDGTLFTVFLDTLNNKCDGDEATSCTTDADCTGIGNGLCGLAGYGDWCIPNVKRLQSIVDYSVFSPSSIVPGATISSLYWSSTTLASPASFAWGVRFSSGSVFGNGKSATLFARAVRPCS